MNLLSDHITGNGVEWLLRCMLYPTGVICVMTIGMSPLASIVVDTLQHPSPVPVLTTTSIVHTLRPSGKVSSAVSRRGALPKPVLDAAATDSPKLWQNCDASSHGETYTKTA